MVTFLIWTGITLSILLVYVCGYEAGRTKGKKLSDKECEKMIKLGYEHGIKDSEAYVANSMKKAMDLIEAELNKKGFTLKGDNKRLETDKDKKIEAALAQQRSKSQNEQQTTNKLKPPLKIVKNPGLKIVKNDTDISK